MAGSLVVEGTQTGAITDPRQIGPFQILMGLTNEVIDQAVAASFMTFTPPTAVVTLGVIVVPDSGVTGTLTLKGVTGDTGVQISSTYPSVITWGATVPTTFGITGSAAAGNIQLIYF